MPRSGPPAADDSAAENEQHGDRGGEGTVPTFPQDASRHSGGGLAKNNRGYWFVSWDWERTAALLRSERDPRALASRALFAAIDGCAPEEYLRNLVRLYPEALRYKGGITRLDLPLHLLMRRAAAGGAGGPWSASIINTFIEGYPAALAERDSALSIPMRSWMRAWEGRRDVGTMRKFRDVLRTVLDFHPESALVKIARGTPWRRRSVLDMVEWHWLEDFSNTDFDGDDREEVREVHWDVLMMTLKATCRAERIRTGLAQSNDADFLPIHAYIQLERRTSPIRSVASLPEGQNVEDELWSMIRKDEFTAFFDRMKTFNNLHGIRVRPTSLHSARLAYRMCRSDVLADIVRRYPEQVRAADGDGNCPLHLAARRSRVTSNVFQLLASADPAAARAPDRRGRLPLHLAVDAGRSWEEGLEVILAAAPQALSTPDLTTHLYPFMAAAVGGRGSLDTVYRLLRQGPNLVLELSCSRSAMRPSKRKRVESQQ